jgi:hypothetical protein
MQISFGIKENIYKYQANKDVGKLETLSEFLETLSEFLEFSKAKATIGILNSIEVSLHKLFKPKFSFLHKID